MNYIIDFRLSMLLPIILVCFCGVGIYYDLENRKEKQKRKKISYLFYLIGIISLILIIGLIFEIDNFTKNPTYVLNEWDGETKIINVVEIKKEKEPAKYKIIDSKNKTYYIYLNEKDVNSEILKVGNAEVKQVYKNFYWSTEKFFYGETEKESSLEYY